MAGRDLSRRLILQASAGAAVAPLGREAGAATGPKRLIVILLRGAVDGLSVVVPYAD